MAHRDKSGFHRDKNRLALMYQSDLAEMLAHLLHAEEDICRESYVVGSDLGMWSATTEAYIWQCFAHMRGGFRGRRSAGNVESFVVLRCLAHPPVHGRR